MVLIYTYVVTFFIILNAETTLDIWKDVLAVSFIVEIDSMVYAAMKKGLFGTMLKKVANETELTVDVKADRLQAYEKAGSHLSFFSCTGMSVAMLAFIV